ncbi:D-inositol-3-phosphate glycosyltransferase [subsurface metagenome]
MRIGIISTYPPMQCGIAAYCSYLVSELEAKGPSNKIHIVSPFGKGEGSFYSVSSLDGLAVSERVFNAMAAFQPDVVHIQHEYGLYGPNHGVAIIPLLYRLKLASIPIIVTLHTVYDSFSQHQKLITEAICRIANAIIVHEEYQRQSIEREIFPFEHIYVVPHGVRIVDPVPEAKNQLGMRGKKIVLLCGYFRPTKRFDRIISIFPRIAEKVPSAELVAAGGVRLRGCSEYEHGILRLINSSPSRDRIRILKGPFPQEVFDTILSAADVVILPYEIGAQSGILAHCLAFGKPVVLSPLSSFQAMVNKVNCGFIAYSDQDFVDYIVKIISHPGLAESLSKNAKDYVKKHLSWKIVAEKHMEIYGRIVRILSRAEGAKVPANFP